MQATLMSFVLVALGGALGAMSRLGLTLAWQRQTVLIPMGTFASNLIGCLVMGIVVQLLAEADWFSEGGLVNDQNRLLFAIGFCGSFTTLSALVVEMHTMMQRQEMLLAFAYLFLTILGGFACLFAGILLARFLIQFAGS